MKNYRFNFLIFLFLCSCLSANAQLDSTRIKTFNDKLQVGLFVSDNYATANFQSINSYINLKQTFILKPTLGLQFAYNGAVLALGTGFPIPTHRFNNEDYENAYAININGYYSRPKYVLWGAFRYFQGFQYNQNIDTSNIGVPSFVNASGSYMHIFNENNYSFRAAYRQADQQLKSGGSLLLKVGATHNRILDSSLVDVGINFYQIHSQGISIFSGYGYTFNLNQNWFISAMVLGGVDFQRINTSRNDSSRYSFAPTYDFKSSIGYNSDNFYIAMTFSVDNRLSINRIDENINFDYDYFKTDLRFGIRIDAPKFVRKMPFIN